MPKHDGVFVPHPYCTVASGDYFAVGKCLASCSAHQKKSQEKRIKELERLVAKLEAALIRHGIKF